MSLTGFKIETEIPYTIVKREECLNPFLEQKVK
jgi:hypothetical protein